MKINSLTVGIKTAVLNSLNISATYWFLIESYQLLSMGENCRTKKKKKDKCVKLTNESNKYIICSLLTVVSAAISYKLNYMERVLFQDAA